MSRSTFYYNRAKTKDRWAAERRLVVTIFNENKGRYGYRRITDEMRNRGYVINHKTVRRLMKEAGVVCMVRIKKYRSYKGEVGRIAPDLIQRKFRSIRPYEKMVTDVSEFALFGTKLYLSPVLDLYNGEVLYYTLYEHPVLDMVTDMLNGVVKKIGHMAGSILHSDQGWQYQHKKYQNILIKNGIQQSMSRKGNCLDNAVMENFFGLLKSELLYLQTFESAEDFKKELHAYIKYYNEKRIKSRLGGMSPVKYRKTHEQNSIGASAPDAHWNHHP